MESIYTGHTAEVKRLIATRVPVNIQNKDGTSPLHAAAGKGNTDIMKLLIENKANINITDKQGDTPLIDAAYYCAQMAAVCKLVEAGADITIRGYYDMTAADWAQGMSNYTVAKYLVTQAPHIRFRPSLRKESGELHRVKGRSLRAIERDLKENASFVNHMLHRLNHFCIGKH